MKYSSIVFLGLTAYAPSVIAAHQIQTDTQNVGFNRYFVTCAAGDPSFNDLELQIEPLEANLYGPGGLGPPGWVHVAGSFMEGGREYIRFSGPQLACPSPPGGYVFDITYAGVLPRKSVEGRLTKNMNVIYRQCVGGWARGDLWALPAMSTFGLALAALFVVVGGAWLFHRNRVTAYRPEFTVS